MGRAVVWPGPGPVWVARAIAPQRVRADHYVLEAAAAEPPQGGPDAR